MTSVPDTRRLARGRVIAATPGAVIRFDNFHYKVRSQSSAHYYDLQLLSSWRCTCPDFARRSRACKHIYALKEVRHAQQEAQHFITAREISEEELLEMIVQQLQDPELPGAKQQRLHIYRNALILPDIPFELRYWWKGRDPEALFDPIAGITYHEPAEGIKVRTPKNIEWRFAEYDAEQLREYVLDNDLHVVDKAIEQTRRGHYGSWQSLFTLTFATTYGPKAIWPGDGHGQFSPLAQLQEVAS